MDLKGKTVFVTGSSRGIGAACAEAFAKKGANVIVNGRHGVSDELVKRRRLQNDHWRHFRCRRRQEDDERGL